MSSKKLKVLCLHGYRQNTEIFKSKCGGFRKLFRNKIEFVIIDAPHLIPIESLNSNDDDNNDQINEYLRGWWFSTQCPDYYSSSHRSEINKGFDQSIELIKNTFDSMGPFDGMLGFSQGAALVTLICCLKTLNELKELNFNFAIIIAGFKSLSTYHLKLFDKLEDKVIQIPTLHIIGENDKVIIKERSEELLKYFSSPIVIHHPGGHLVPSSSSYKAVCNKFIDAFLLEEH